MLRTNKFHAVVKFQHDFIFSFVFKTVHILFTANKLRVGQTVYELTIVLVREFMDQEMTVGKVLL
jgi:hypothetical protein